MRYAVRAVAMPVAVVMIVWGGLCVDATGAAGARNAALLTQQSSLPTVMPPGATSESIFENAGNFSNVKLEVRVINVGGAEAAGPISVVDTVGPGLEVSPTLVSEWFVNAENGALEHPCTVVANTVTCEVSKGLAPGDVARIIVPVNVTGPAGAEVPNDVVASAGPLLTSSSHSTVTIGSQPASFGFEGSDGLFGSAFDGNGDVPSAGTHPHSAILTMKVPTRSSVGGRTHPVEPLRSLSFSLPPGLIINPLGAATRCLSSRLEAPNPTCPAGSQIGVVRAVREYTDEAEALYSLVPPAGVPAEVGFSVFGIGVRARGGLDGSFRLTASSIDLIEKLGIQLLEVELWGNPSDGTHIGTGENCSGGCEIEASRAPVLTMPSACQPMPLTGAVESWLGGREERTVDFTDRLGQALEVAGCQNVPFSPAVTVRPTSRQASSPTGLGLEIDLPQNQSQGGTASGTLKKVAVRLPEGLTVNPPAADGLGACSPEQIGIGNAQASRCPEASKVGTVEIETPLLDAPLKGSVYVAEQRNNPFRTLLGLYLAVEGEGVVVKLAGRVDLDPSTGQVTATFDNNPQIPFESLNVQFASGPRSTLVTPTACGTYNIRAELTSWASPAPVVIDSPFKVDQACSSGAFGPRLEAGTTNPVAGAFSQFTLRISRQDGEQNLSRISATLPQGLLAKLAGVPLCPGQQAASGACPIASRVGTTTTAVGAGPQPLFIPQAERSPTAIYLAGPYRGAPYSLVVKVPAQAGPFDLGTIAVRVALFVDPFNTQVTASSDPLPQILEGIPVSYRDVRVDTSRPEFIVNPTNCEPTQIVSSIEAPGGATATPSTRFQVAGCSSLAFKPSLKLSLKGSTKRTGHPALKAVVTYPTGGPFANIARAQVSLPGSEFLDQGNLNRTCTKPVLLEAKCPQSSIYGTAKAWTPLLDRPVEGPVYLVGGFGYKLPALVAELNGQIRVLLVGKVDTGTNKGIRNTFEAVPDAPVSRFVLEMKGGKKYSLLENSKNLCKESQYGQARFTAQNGAVETLRPKVSNNCRRKKSGNGHKHQ